MCAENSPEASFCTAGRTSALVPVRMYFSKSLAASRGSEQRFDNVIFFLNYFFCVWCKPTASRNKCKKKGRIDNGQ